MPSTPLDLSQLLGAPRDPLPVSTMARGLIGSEILKIAGEVRERVAQGAAVCNLTVGDFDPAYFRVPALLEQGIVDALRGGETNYPPSSGIDALRKRIEKHDFRIENDLGEDRGQQIVHITLSIGVSTAPDDSDEGMSLIRNADRALYIGAKQAGRNKVAAYVK